MKTIANNYQLIKDIFTLLQSRSNSYPFVNTFVYHEYFVKELGVLDDIFYNEANFEIILSSVFGNNRDQMFDGVK